MDLSGLEGLTLVDILFEIWFPTDHINTTKETNGEIKTNGNTFSLVSDVSVEESMSFFWCRFRRVRISLWAIFNFLQFNNTFLILWLKLNSNYIAIPNAFAEVWTSTHKDVMIKRNVLNIAQLVFSFLTHYFGDPYCLMYKKSNSYAHVYLPSIAGFSK